uniref:Protein KRI1 homolog n=1 Tax=Corvus moneduloides TaxID=1196302 RepID=A0A8U7N8U1_CORMO
MAEPKLRVNAAFAERYGRYRRREELQRRETPGTGPGAGGDGRDRAGLALDPREEREFYRTLALLKTRDPRIYRADTTFYTREGTGGEERPAKPMFLKDYERKVVLEKEGWGTPGGVLGSWGGFWGSPTDAISPQEREEEQYLRWLRGQAEAPPEPLQDLEPLQKFWSDPALEPGERFLRDYLLAGPQTPPRYTWIPPQSPCNPPGPPRASLPSLDDSSDEGEQFLQRQQEFERRHNFRFEEPGAAQIQTFPRHIPTSVRRRDERRKEKREQIRERKKKDRARRREELKQLKNLKRQELAARIARIRDASGSDAFGLTDSLLQEDFDPARHDRLMAVGDPPLGMRPPLELRPGRTRHRDGGPRSGGAVPSPLTAPPPQMDADYVPEAPLDPVAPPARAPPEVSFGKKRRKTKFREALEREKPRFDPASGPFEQYLDEFYALDFEDMVGDLPCRFKYRRVLPCDFGLTTDEILAADDKELNRWCSLRKTCMYRSEQEERQDQANYSRRAQNLGRKHQILRSLVAEYGGSGRRREKGSPLRPPKIPGLPGAGGGPPWARPCAWGGREFSGKRLEAFGLNPRRLRFRQLQRQRGKERGEKAGEPPEKPGKNSGSSGKTSGSSGKMAAVNGKKQKRRKNAPNPQKNT